MTPEDYLRNKLLLNIIATAFKITEYRLYIFKDNKRIDTFKFDRLEDVVNKYEWAVRKGYDVRIAVLRDDVQRTNGGKAKMTHEDYLKNKLLLNTIADTIATEIKDIEPDKEIDIDTLDSIITEFIQEIENIVCIQEKED